MSPSIYTISPDQEGKPMTLTTRIKAVDLIDEIILSEITNLGITLQLDVLLFPQDKKAYEHFFGLIMDLTDNLYKANGHRRSYKTQEKQMLKKFRKECIKSPNKHTNLSLHPMELHNELDGFLSDIKSALDTLAKLINPLIGSKFDAWHKEKDTDGKEKSGLRILKFIENNLPDEAQNRSEEFKRTISDNIEWITYLVSLRDRPVHKGGLKNISDLFYDNQKKEVSPTCITHPQGGPEFVIDFMYRTMQDIILFINRIIVTAIQIKVPSLILAKTPDNNGNIAYRWHVPQSKV